MPKTGGSSKSSMRRKAARRWDVENSIDHGCAAAAHRRLLHRPEIESALICARLSSVSPWLGLPLIAGSSPSFAKLFVSSPVTSELEGQHSVRVVERSESVVKVGYYSFALSSCDYSHFTFYCLISTFFFCRYSTTTTTTTGRSVGGVRSDGWSAPLTRFLLYLVSVVKFHVRGALVSARRFHRTYKCHKMFRRY